MQTQDSKTQKHLHSQMALAIKGAKKALFKNHSAGGDLDQLIEVFVRDVGRRLSKLTSSEYYNPKINIPEADEPDHVTATLPSGEEVELYGDAVDIERQRTDEQKLGAALHEIINNERTPVALYNAVGDFVSSSVSGLRDSQGQSLLDRWESAPETLEAVIKWSIEAEPIGGGQ